MKKVCPWCYGTSEIEMTADEVAQDEEDRQFDEGFHKKKKEFEEGK